MAVEKLRQYLQEHEFIIRTDHKSLAYLNEQNLHSDMQRKAMARLMGLKFRIVYKKGKENVAADAFIQSCSSHGTTSHFGGSTNVGTRSGEFICY